MGTRLIVLRHGKSSWNEEKRCQGSRHEPRLSRRGRRQAVAAARQMRRAHVAPAAIYASDQLRAVETALIVRSALGSAPLYLDARLREMDQGVWEGMSYHDIKSQYGALYSRFSQAPFEVTPPGGESTDEMIRRTFALLDIIAAQHPNSTVLVVSHEFPLAAVACAAAGRSLAHIWKYAPGNCGWFTVRWPIEAPIIMPGEEQRPAVPWGRLGGWASGPS